MKFGDINPVIASVSEAIQEPGRKTGLLRRIRLRPKVVLIEGSWASAVDAATDRLLAGDLAAHGVQGVIERGLYRLEFSRSHFDGI